MSPTRHLSHISSNANKGILVNTKTALVTGSTSGIGLAIASEFAAQGMNVMLNGVESQQFGDEIAQGLAGKTGQQIYYVQADLADPQQVGRLFDTHMERFGALDVLVNNAGIQFTAPTEAFPVEKWDQIIAINLSAAFHATRLALPLMQKNGWGRIINLSSVHGLVGSAHKAAYCASKHGLVGLTKVVAIENAAKGITANCICPGWVDTPLLNNQIADFAKENNVSLSEAKVSIVKAKQPMPELTDPKAIAAMAIFLCSDAGQYVTGAALSIDGGWTAQ